MIKINYKKYIGARDASWRLIIDLGLTELPIDINKIFKDIGIMAGKYSKNKEILKKRGLSELCNNSNAFTVLNSDKHYAFFDDKKSKERIRFTLAHMAFCIYYNYFLFIYIWEPDSIIIFISPLHMWHVICLINHKNQPSLYSSLNNSIIIER